MCMCMYIHACMCVYNIYYYKSVASILWVNVNISLLCLCEFIYSSNPYSHEDGTVKFWDIRESEFVCIILRMYICTQHVGLVLTLYNVPLKYYMHTILMYLLFFLHIPACVYSFNASDLCAQLCPVLQHSRYRLLSK